MIRHILIKNWKVFSEKSLSFQKGLNFIVGRNGSGKTTTLEAIALAVSGDTLLVPFRELAWAQQDTYIEAELDLKGTCYTIERKFRKDRRLSATLRVDKEEISRWDEITQHLMKEMGTEEDFFRRLVYMDEKEVARYLDTPPQTAIAERIQAVFGLRQIERLLSASNNLRIHYQGEARDLGHELEQLSKMMPPSQEELVSLKKQCSDLKIKQEECNKLINITSEEIRTLEKKEAQLTKLLKTLEDLFMTIESKDCVTIKESPVTGINTVMTAFRCELSETDKNIQGLHKNIGRIQGKLSNLNTIVDLLKTVSKEERKKTFPCPVCKRPINYEMGSKLLVDDQSVIVMSRREIDNYKVDLERLEEKRRNLSSILNKLETARLTLTDCEGIKESETYTGFVARLKDLKKAIGDKRQCQQTYRKNAAEIQESLAKAIKEETKGEEAIKMTKYSEMVKNKEVVSEAKLILSEALTEGIEELQRKAGDVKLGPIYHQIGSFYQKFYPKSKGEIRFDENGLLTINGIRHFSHLSGGEKVLLLVLARTVLCKTLSEVPFMMIDEPLEHLDVENRRTLLEFFVACAEQLQNFQLIVTTFEESLTRKYFELKNVNVIYL